MLTRPMSTQNSPPAQPNQSLIDGLTCLQALTGQENAIGSRELARLVGLEPTRVNRLLKTLAYLGMAEQDEKRRYRPGPAVHVLAAQSLRGSRLLRNAIGPLEKLRDLGMTVALGVLWRDQVSYLYHALPNSSTGDAIGGSVLYPAESSGLGHVLLAATDLGPEFESVRERGYAVTPFEDRPIRTVAVPIGSPAYAAIGISGEFPDSRISELVSRLKEAVHQIEGS